MKADSEVAFKTLHLSTRIQTQQSWVSWFALEVKVKEVYTVQEVSKQFYIVQMEKGSSGWW